MLGEFSWAASVSAIQGLVAKEQVVSSMSVIAGLSSDVSDGSMILIQEYSVSLPDLQHTLLWPLTCFQLLVLELLAL